MGVPLSQHAIYRFGLAFTMLAFADPTSFIGYSEYNTPIKYLYTCIVLSFLCFYMLKNNSVNPKSLGPFMALLFFFITTMVFVFNLINYGYRLSYSAAFTSSLLFAAAAFIPPSAVLVDATRISRQILLMFFACTIFYLGETIFKSTKIGQSLSSASGIEFGKSIVSVLGLCLAILLRRTLFVFLFAGVTALALIVRPSSTLVLGIITCIPLAFLLQIRAIGLSRVLANTVLILVALSPFALYVFFDQLREFISAAESAVKGDVLGGRSNAEFRLVVVNKALHQLEGTSFWYGNGLDGNTTVFVGQDIPSWFAVDAHGLATIHSDFVIVLSQAGLVGYSLFIIFICLVLNRRFRNLACVRIGNDDLYNLLSISIVAVVTLILYCSVNPFLQYYYLAHPVWLLLFISELAGKSTISRELLLRNMTSMKTQH
jgi:hypothetical protein